MLLNILIQRDPLQVNIMITLLNKVIMDVLFVKINYLMQIKNTILNVVGLHFLMDLKTILKKNKIIVMECKELKYSVIIVMLIWVMFLMMDLNLKE